MATENFIMAMVQAGGNRYIQSQCCGTEQKPDSIGTEPECIPDPDLDTDPKYIAMTTVNKGGKNKITTFWARLCPKFF